MIKDQEFLHGAAFLRVINFGLKIALTHLSDIHSSVYLVETNQTDSTVLFKVSTKPQSAWSFTFSLQEEIAIAKLHQHHTDAAFFVALVCHQDGICCLSEKQLGSILDVDKGIAGQRLSVSRKPHGSYHVNGTGRVSLEQTVPQNNWPRIILSG